MGWFFGLLAGMSGFLDDLKNDFLGTIGEKIVEINRSVDPAFVVAYIRLGQVITGAFTIDVLLKSLSADLNIVAGQFREIANAIHLKTLIKIHQIAYLTSLDYRLWWKSFYDGLSDVSKAMGYDAQFLALLFRNSRQIFIDVNTTMGMSYDEADLIWLEKFSVRLEGFAEHADVFSENPESLFNDLDRWLHEDEVNKKSQFMAGTFVALTTVLETTVKTVEDLIIIREDIDQLVTDLPADIKRGIRPFIENVFESFDSFIDHTYKPSVSSLKDSLKLVGIKLDEDAENVFQLTKRLINPVDYLLEIDDMPLGAKLEQQGKLTELVTRSLHTEADSMVEIAEPTQSELLAIARAKRVPTKLLVGLPPEFPDPITPAGVSPKPRKTWFVGDF